MKKTIIEIEKLSAFLFDDEEYNKFVYYIETNQIEDARLMIDKEIIKNTDIPHVINSFELSIAENLVDLIDLMVMDGERRKEEFKSNTG